MPKNQYANVNDLVHRLKTAARQEAALSGPEGASGHRLALMRANPNYKAIHQAEMQRLRDLTDEELQQLAPSPEKAHDAAEGQRGDKARHLHPGIIGDKPPLRPQQRGLEGLLPSVSSTQGGRGGAPPNAEELHQLAQAEALESVVYERFGRSPEQLAFPKPEPVPSDENPN